MVCQILISSKHEPHSLGFQIMPFTEITLALANMCLVIHVMGKLFNILKELSYENIYFWKFTFAKSSPLTHTIVTETCCKYITYTYYVHIITSCT